MSSILGTSSNFAFKNIVENDRNLYTLDPFEWLCSENFNKIKSWVPLDFLDSEAVFKSEY